MKKISNQSEPKLKMQFVRETWQKFHRRFSSEFKYNHNFTNATANSTIRLVLSAFSEIFFLKLK